MITVVGKMKDTAQYAGQEGYNVYSLGIWTRALNQQWLCAAYNRGDSFLLVSPIANGFYREEIAFLYGLMLQKGFDMTTDLTGQVKQAEVDELFSKILSKLRELKMQRGHPDARRFAIVCTMTEAAHSRYLYGVTQEPPEDC